MPFWRVVSALVIAPTVAIGALSVAEAVLPPSQPAAAEEPVIRPWAERNVQFIPSRGCRAGTIRLAGNLPAGLEDRLISAPVRSGPGDDYPNVDTVRDGEIVSICQERQAAAPGARNWVGIVYGRLPANCSLEGGSDTQRDYGGPCRSGWIEPRYVQSGPLIASEEE